MSLSEQDQQKIIESLKSVNTTTEYSEFRKEILAILQHQEKLTTDDIFDLADVDDLKSDTKRELLMIARNKEREDKKINEKKKIAELEKAEMRTEKPDTAEVTRSNKVQFAKPLVTAINGRSFN